jgi:hypothetical protein
MVKETNISGTISGDDQQSHTTIPAMSLTSADYLPNVLKWDIELILTASLY